MNNIILAQLLEHFKTIIEEIMLKERRDYLLENSNTRANGYYTRTPKTILGKMELNIPRTRDGKFKSSIISSTFDIAEEVISEFKSRKLVDDYSVLYIDATYVALKRDSVEKASVWKEILEDLREIRMIISDDLAGLDEAITDVFPSVEHQLCCFHLKWSVS